MRVRVLILLVAIAAALLLQPALVSAQTEQILDFHSEIWLMPDSSLRVIETITVDAAGNQIRHGIYRDFPTRYHDALNNNHVVDFQVLGAARDSNGEPFRIEAISNGKRIYLGDPRSLVPRGRHVYTLDYTTTRQLGFFKDHDELFWNVTGNGWGFTIQHASATVHLPGNISAEDVKLSGFTGPQGSREAQLTSSIEGGAFQFATTRVLGPHEGLTILLIWPKGYFAEPTTTQQLQFFVRDNGSVLLLTVGLIVLLVYYSVAWSAVGRDPEKGVIMPFYDPPPELSPAGMRYLMRMGFDNKTFASAILDMAVRGFLIIKQQAGSYTLYTTGKDNRVLTPDEKQIAACLFDGRNQIWLHNENHVAIAAAIKSLKKWLATAEQKIYFVTNSRYMIAPMVVSIATFVAALLTIGIGQTAGGIFICFWLTFWTLGVSALMFTVYKAWKTVATGPKTAAAEVTGVGYAMFITCFSIPFLFGEVMGFTFLLKLSSPALVIFLIIACALHAVFFHLLKAPTFAGRRLMDKVEGFKMFLGAVDGDRLDRIPSPDQSTAVFEKFLPYAMALDVEKTWADKFSGVFGTAATAPGSNSPAYTPSFYSGNGWNGFTGASFASSFGSSLTSAISSSSTAPGSGGGGGSGGSGGGGGGGGGGGW
ncbi:MAG TPA: DUF2207 domain-containing protein [Methylomirabilota bacterium]|nr:DUF2207 domain-containing protein [Methylomirabilota bacterium]